MLLRRERRRVGGLDTIGEQDGLKQFYFAIADNGMNRVQHTRSSVLRITRGA